MSVAAAVREWIAAVGTGGGFIVAAAVYAGSVRDRRRRKAALVNAWMAPAETYGEHSGLIELRNGSDEPVYNILIESREQWMEVEMQEEGMEEGMERVRGFRVLTLPVLAPDESATLGVSDDPGWRHVGGVTLHFTDAAGRSWVRTAPNYRLRRESRVGMVLSGWSVSGRRAAWWLRSETARLARRVRR